MKYFLYARKSSESEDRQIQSIDDQVNRLKELAKNLNLKIVHVFTESKSAKQPNNRHIFDEMMQRIEDDEAQGILCWQINRLSRNPIDSAKIQWLLQQKTLKSIQTIDRTYLPDDNVLLFSVESGMANQYVLDLSKNTKRGMQSKREKGYMPHLAPIGYLNDKEEKTIIKDPERFDLIRKMWDLMLTGKYSPPQILEIANNEWGFTTRKFKRMGGNSLSRSTIYTILTNIAYTGLFENDGKQYQGSYEPMITLDEYDRAQFILGKKGKPRPKTHKFAFTGLIRCSECGAYYTAETKKKLLKSGEVREHTYYHCTKRKKDIKCTQKKNIPEKEIEKQIEDEVSKITILPQFRDWALEVLNKNNDKELMDRGKIHEMLNRSIESTQKQLDNLTKMRYRELIDEDEYVKERNVLKEKIDSLRKELRETESRADNWIETTEKVFEFATNARNKFINGDLETKKTIAMSLGSNFFIRDGKLSLEPHKWLIPIAKEYPKLEQKYIRLEPTKNRKDKEKIKAIAGIKESWLPR